MKKIKSATPMSTKTVRERESLIAHVEEDLRVWIEDQSSHSAPLSQSPILSRALTPFSAVKAER